MPIFYRVCVTNGHTEDGNGGYLGSDITEHCGHLHPTEDDARDCFDALYERGQNIHWHGASILPVNAGGAEVL